MSSGYTSKLRNTVRDSKRVTMRNYYKNQFTTQLNKANPNISIIKNSLANDSELIQSKIDNKPVLLVAIENGNPDLVKTLLNAGSDPNLVYQGNPMIVYAVQNGNVDVVNALLAAGVDPNQKDKSKNPIAITAIEKGFDEIVLSLFDKISNPASIADRRKIPVVKYVIESDKEDFLQALLKKGLVYDIQVSTGSLNTKKEGSLYIVPNTIDRQTNYKAMMVRDGSPLFLINISDHFVEVLEKYRKDRSLFRRQRRTLKVSSRVPPQGVKTSQVARPGRIYKVNTAEGKKKRHRSRKG
jgi:hypothetical protein